MKSVLSLLLLAGIALGYSTSYYGWVPQRELLYHFESQVLSGLPEIDSQYAGLKLSSIVRIQSFPDYSLRIKIEYPRFVTINERLPIVDGKIVVPPTHMEEIPESIRLPLVKPFEVHIKRGVVESLFVEKSEPVVVTNLKKALLSQIQMDMSASREGLVQKLNHVVVPREEILNISFFKTQEQTLLGDCETSYTIHPLPLYQARELEEEWRVNKMKLVKTFPGGFKTPESEMLKTLHEAEKVCAGQEYLEIVKTKNFENCRERPVYSSMYGIEGSCDPTKTSCEDIFTRISSTRYIVCGTPEQFTIRKVLGLNKIVARPGLPLASKELLEQTSTVTLELLKVETAGYKPLVKPVEPKKITKLFMEFPEKALSPKGINERYETLSPEKPEELKLKTLSGFYPLHPMPELTLPPTMFLPLKVPQTELLHQIKEIMIKLVSITYESPESCTSSTDVAGLILEVAQSLRPLSLEEIKAIRVEVLRYMETRSVSLGSVESYNIAKTLLHDILSMVGTNPSIVLIKELVESEEIPLTIAPTLLQTAIKGIKTPTPELLETLITLVKNIRSKSLPLHSVIATSVSDLIYRACINPSPMVAEFPVGIYGNFCSPETSLIKEKWVPYLIQRLESSSRKPETEMVTIIYALGKLGHIETLTPLTKTIEGKITPSPLVRSMAVYNLKRVAVLEPSLVRPILLSLINNPAETPEIRIAAVAILPYTSPSIMELEKIALRTWFEPSKQVVSFIYSTFKSLEKIDIPELLYISKNIEKVIPLVKPVQTGILFSHNCISGRFVKFLDGIMANTLSAVHTERSVFPSKIKIGSNFLTRSFKIEGLEFSLYTKGMDYVLEKLMHVINIQPEVSKPVVEELRKIEEKLQIKPREIIEPEAFIHTRFLGLERLITINPETYMEVITKITEELKADPMLFTKGLTYNTTRSHKLLETLMIEPTISGFPAFFETSLPVVYSLRASLVGEKMVLPKSMPETLIPITGAKLEIIPVVNAKLSINLGVVSPLTRQIIGTVVETSIHTTLPTELKMSLNKEAQLSVTVKTPEEIKKEIELLHFIVRPMTYTKSLGTIMPIAKSAGHKLLLSGEPLKETLVNPLLPLGIDAPIKISTDYKILDIASIFNKLRQSPNPLIALETLALPSSSRYISIQIRLNPLLSHTKEFNMRLSLAHGKKSTPSESMTLTFPKTLSHTGEIKNICTETHVYEHEIKECMKTQERSILSTEGSSTEATMYCTGKLIKPSTEEMTTCLKTFKVCEETKTVCLRKSMIPMVCEEKKIACMVRHTNVQKMSHVLRKLQKGYALGLTLEFSINSHYEMKSTAISMVLGGKTVGPVVEQYIEAEITTPLKEVYIVETDIKTTLPILKSRWSLEQLLSEDITLETLVSLRFGRKTEELKEIKLISKLLKTESQKLSIRRSVEYQTCNKMIAEGKMLAPICELVRHQAAALDKLVLKLRLPEVLMTYPLPIYVRESLRVLFFPQLKETVYETPVVSSLKKDEVVIEALISREGEEAQLKMLTPKYELEVVDLRLPLVLRNVIPLSLRINPLYRLVQKATSYQVPASCKIENDYVSTFDNLTYTYSLNNCEHLLLKDCSKLYPVAVTARGSSGQKEVKIVSGLTVVELKTSTGSVLSGIYVNGEKKMLPIGGMFVKKSPTTGKPVLEIRSYLDGVVVVREFESMIELIFDGERIELIAPQLLTSRACGLCGDLNGETTAELRTPKMCVFEKPRIAAYTYMIKESTCMGIPTQDKPEYETETRACIKKEEIRTPLEPLTKSIVKVKSGPLGVILKHVVEHRANGNEICLSKTPVSICEEKTLPIIGESVSVPMTCMQSYSELAQTLMSKVEAREEIPELAYYPITYIRMQEIPTSCKPTTETISISSSTYRRGVIRPSSEYEY